MQKLVVATRNKGKARELEQLLANFNFEILTLTDCADVPKIIEDGGTFIANAKKKAIETAAHLGMLVLADDSGLVVDALAGQPGIYSARYAGPTATDQDNNAKLLCEMVKVPMHKRTARFKAAMVLADHTGLLACVEGSCEGIILKERRGQGGFGYDPIFYLPHLGKTFAELTNEEKNTFSHRAQALKKMATYLRALS